MLGRVLIVDDEQSMCELIEADLRLRQFESTWRTSAEEAFDLLKGDAEFDVLLTDLKMPGMSGLELCERAVAVRPDIPVVVMTAFGSLETAVAAIRAGAYDFVTKPIELDMLAIALKRAVEHHQLQEKVKVLRQAARDDSQFGGLLGVSQPMQRLYAQLNQIADAEAAVLIAGESGTGKELVARAIHDKGPRSEKPFVAVNCAAFAEPLLESELFGHAKGAFTDARSDRKGLFQQASGGTLFLDEVGEMSLTMQPKLLRVLEQGVVRPVGSDQEIDIDVRLISATHRDLELAIDEERFREDLFFRINVIQVDLPPLRARAADILPLAQYFVTMFAARSGKDVHAIATPAAEKLLAYDWPGNVRELRNVIERAIALTRFDQVSVDDLPEKIRNYRSSQVLIGGDDPSELLTLEEMERRYIQHVLKAVGGNKTLAAKTLGLDRKTIYRKLGSD